MILVNKLQFVKLVSYVFQEGRYLPNQLSLKKLKFLKTELRKQI